MRWMFVGSITKRPPGHKRKEENVWFTHDGPYTRDSASSFY